MMRTFATDIITRAALAAGLPEGRVINMVKKDNLTIERPRMELQFMPEKYTRSGRTLGLSRDGAVQTRKRELYVVEQDVAANAMADDEAWLERFSYAFIAALPRGRNDANGNWVKIRAQKATFSRPSDKRVGDKVIEVFPRANRLFLVTFTWRITGEETESLIPSFDFNITHKQGA